MAKSPIAILYDHVNSRFVKYIQEGTESLIGVASKIRNVAGTVIDPAVESKQDAAITWLTSLDGKVATQTTLATLATETKLEAVRVLLNSLDGKDFATQTTLATLATETKLETVRVLLDSLDNKDFATETTLATRASEATLATRATEATLLSADGRLTTIDAVLDSIKDTDGVKKITDALPVGDNWIGKIKVGDGTYVAETRMDDFGTQRLAVDSIGIGGAVSIGSPFPEDPEDIYDFHLEDSGGSQNLLVDGSGTPVVFSAVADATRDVRIYEIRVVFSSDDFIVDGSSFGPNLALTNGLKLDLLVNDGSAYELINIQRNTDFMQFYGSVIGSNTVINNSGPKDVIVSTFAIGGLMKLVAGTADKITVTVRDNLTSSKFKVLEFTVYGVKI